MARMAAILGKKEDALQYAGLAKNRKEFFNQTYFDLPYRKTIHSGFKQSPNSPAKPGDLIDTQTSYVLPLAFHLYRDEDKGQIVKNLLTTIKRENKVENGKIYPSYSLMTGFIGTAWINRVLSDNEAADVAYYLLQQTTYPSWLYSVEQGATTIWERLNSYTHTDGFGGNNSMNSFNHYSFGAVGSWMYNYSLGIERDINEPGFKHFILQPDPDPTGQMTFASGYYDSMYGRIKSRWEIKDGVCHFHFLVPANTTATLYLPASSLESILESGKRVETATGITHTGQTSSKYIFELQSGEYHFTSIL
jgi:alpha-L-rhamnosidase